jgi:hypothetical protein
MPTSTPLTVRACSLWPCRMQRPDATPLLIPLTRTSGTVPSLLTVSPEELTRMLGDEMVVGP